MSPAPIRTPADLTPTQRAYLRNLRGYCQQAPTLAGIYLKVWRNVLGMLTFAGLGIWVFLEREQPTAAWALGTAFLGAMLRDLGYYRQTVRLWPATQAILDQVRLDELLAAPNKDADW